jgi:integrase/recombinase XerD
MPAKKKPQTWIEDFRADCKLRNLGATKIYCLYAAQFVALLETRDKTPLKADRADLKAFLQSLRDRGLKPASVDRAFGCVSQFFEYLVDEEYRDANPVIPFRRRYLHKYKEETADRRRLLTTEEASILLNSVLDSRDKAILALLFKTGIRRGELSKLDLSDVDLPGLSITLKPTAKRSNRLVFFDYETARTVEEWLDVRPHWRYADKALFPSLLSPRTSPQQVNYIVKERAIAVGLHDLESKSISKRVTAHCGRHWFVTSLLRAGMNREYVKWLRGDAMREAIDIYHHIDPDDVKKEYLAHIPQLGL